MRTGRGCKSLSAVFLCHASGKNGSADLCDLHDQSRKILVGSPDCFLPEVWYSVVLEKNLVGKGAIRDA
jgi:hypothetical protein